MAVLVISLATAECGGIGSAPTAASRANYAFGFYNASKDDQLTEVEATWAANGVKHVCGAGLLVPDAQQHGGMGTVIEEQPSPMPPRVTLAWRGPDGRRHSRDMEVAGKVPNAETFTGTVYFKYVGDGQDGGWRVIPLSKVDENNLASQGQPMIAPDLPEPLTPQLPPVAGPREPKGRPDVRPPTTNPTSGTVPDRNAILDAMKAGHLGVMRPELIELNDYCQSADPATQKYIQASSRIATAAHGLADAVRARFGAKAAEEMNLEFPDAGKVLKDGWQSVREAGDPLPGELEKATVDVQGDRATIHVGTESMAARRVGGKWKIELPSLAQAAAAEGLAGNPQADPRVMARAAEAEAIIDERLAMDVRAGQFQTAAQVTEARSTRRSAAGDILRGEVEGKPGPTTNLTQ